MSKQKVGFVAVGFILFSKSPLRRVAALGYLRARPTVNTAQLLREYVAWEPRSILRTRGVRMLKRLEATL